MLTTILMLCVLINDLALMFKEVKAPVNSTTLLKFDKIKITEIILLIAVGVFSNDFKERITAVGLIFIIGTSLGKIKGEIKLDTNRRGEEIIRGRNQSIIG